MTTSSLIGNARSTSSVVEPREVHTRRPARSSTSRTPLPAGASSRWDTVMYGEENSTTRWRAQVTVKLFTTTSTSPSWMAVVRSAMFSTTNCTRFGSPKIAAAMRRAMSMSDPSSSPVSGFR